MNAILRHLGLTPERVAAMIAANPAPPHRRAMSATERNRTVSRKHPALLPICRDLFCEHPASHNKDIAEMIRQRHPDFKDCSVTWLRMMVKINRGQIKRRAYATTT